ncbi:MAG: PEPxxWA-CTERM sorting domain-containing protein [Sphingomonas phyllosphaerae]
MFTVATRCMSVAAAALLAASSSTPACAAELFPGISIQSVSVLNQYSYTFGAERPPSTTGGTQGTILQSDQRPFPSSQLGVDYTGRATTDSFYFLHNDYCVGQCLITSSTTIRFEIEVTDAGNLEGLRFDSLITPGHLALVGIGSYEDTAASFNFSVSRTDFVRGEESGETNTLYAANGYSDIFGLRVFDDNGDNPFANTITGDNGGAGQYYDWSATPLSVELGSISTGDTFYVDYTASYSVKSFNKCSDILNCNAAQVVFGDPRNIGGGTDASARLADRALFANDPTVDGGVHAVITRDYEASVIPFAFVPSGADRTIETPAANAPITYVGNYIPSLIDTDGSSGVPEPATWMTMILGFGVVGGALRQRRGRRIMI